MERETIGIVISVSKQWWLKINNKPFRTHITDGTSFPYIIKIKYNVKGKEYISRKWISPGNAVPGERSNVRVFYDEDKPSKIRLEL